MAEIISAVFNDASDAQRAVNWLRDSGVPENAISVVSRRHDDHGAMGTDDEYDDEAADDAADAGRGAGVGAAVGAGVGALFGLAALAIPGVGPFITAGALATALGTTGGAIASGALVGGTSGALAGALSGYGVNEKEAGYYAGEVERGGTYVGVDVSQTTLDRDSIRDGLNRFNGRFAS